MLRRTAACAPVTEVVRPKMGMTIGSSPFAALFAFDSGSHGLCGSCSLNVRAGAVTGCQGQHHNQCGKHCD